MPNGSRWTDHCLSQFRRYSTNIRAELLADARLAAKKNPITPEHVDWLREQMVIQNRLRYEIKSHHAEGGFNGTAD
jgi:hypothetical protein